MTALPSHPDPEGLLEYRFLGMRPLETFLCNDVVKEPRVEEHIARYRDHLRRVFG
jgi:modulator of drug activity B